MAVRRMDQERRIAVGAVAGMAWVAVLLTVVPGYAKDSSTHKHKSGAKICYVDHFKYTNKGGYTVDTLDLVVVDKSNNKRHNYDGAYYSGKLGNDIRINQTHGVNLNDFVGVEDEFGEGSLRDGWEVWLTIPIVAGGEPSCHKDGHKLIFKKGIGRTIEFKSEGTTQNDHRCQYKTEISKQCDGSLP